MDSTTNKKHFYVAFLRGINVGGKNSIKMSDLAASFESMGFTDVKTYINSGNVVFASSVSGRKSIEMIIAYRLAGDLDYRDAIFIRKAKEISETIEGFPKVFNDPDWKHNIIFLANEIDSPKLLGNYKIREGNEVNSYIPGVLYWSVMHAAGTRAIMYKLSQYPEYKQMTVRSIGTIRKVMELMKEGGSDGEK